MHPSPLTLTRRHDGGCADLREALRLARDEALDVGDIGGGERSRVCAGRARRLRARLASTYLRTAEPIPVVGHARKRRRWPNLGAAGWSVEPTASRVVVMWLSDVTEHQALARRRRRFDQADGYCGEVVAIKYKDDVRNWLLDSVLHPRGPLEAAAEIQVPREGKPGRGRLPGGWARASSSTETPARTWRPSADMGGARGPQDHGPRHRQEHDRQRGGQGRLLAQLVGRQEL